jgi:DNA ligase D-like protein (predicted ligase)
MPPVPRPAANPYLETVTRHASAGQVGRGLAQGRPRAKGQTAIFGLLSPTARARLRSSSLPAWMAPMLATLTDERFSDPAWIFERKLDGERCLAFRDEDVRLLSRNRRLLNGAYPEIVEALERQSARFIVDGEIVAFAGRETSFARLQGRMGLDDPARARATGIPVSYYVFDILWLDGQDTTRLELLDRKRLLEAAITFEAPLRYTAHRVGDGERFYRQACRSGWEGLIAKRGASPYVHRRSPDWLKFKCVAEQELVIGGWTDPEGGRTDFGALLVGYYDGAALVYAGKVGTGYDAATLRALGARLRLLVRPTSPFARGDPPAAGAHWAKPVLVAEVGFSEWTRAGKLRHPRYLGLRPDKPAREVVRETPGPAQRSAP